LVVAVQLAGEIGDYRLATGRVKVAAKIGRWINLFEAGKTLPGGFNNS
jgi:hypothetical protein